MRAKKLGLGVVHRTSSGARLRKELLAELTIYPVSSTSALTKTKTKKDSSRMNEGDSVPYYKDYTVCIFQKQDTFLST